MGLFNMTYGGLGLAASLYLGRPEGAALCLWVIGVGVAMTVIRPAVCAWRARDRRKRIVMRARASS